MAEEEERSEEENQFSGENPGEVSEEKKKELEEKQKEFEYEETHQAGENLKEEIKEEKKSSIFMWIIAFLVLVGLGFLYWWLIL